MLIHAMNHKAGISFVLVLFILFITSCDPASRDKKNSPEIGNYIAAYTSGVISAHSEIMIRFTEDNPNAGNFYEALEQNPFEIEPSIKGQVYWINEYTLGFNPEGKFDQGTLYEVTLNLKTLIDVEEDLSKFNFAFQTRVMDFKVNVGTLTPYPGQADLYRLNGDVDFSDVMDAGLVDKIFEAAQDGRKIPIAWRGLKNNMLFEFSIDSIHRGDLASEVTLEWDASQQNIDVRGSQQIEIPSKSDFELLKVRVYQLPSQRVVLSFSDQLKGDQLLDGLIMLDGDDDLNFRIDGNKLEVYSDRTYEGTVNLSVEAGIKSNTDAEIKKQLIREINFSRLKPQLSLVNKGVILPSSQGLVLPFKAVGLNKVDIQIIKVYENNIPQFLQVNKIDNDYEIRRVGRPVLKHTIDLAATGLDMNSWNFFSVDLSELIRTEPGAIYNIEFLFYKKYSAYECLGGGQEEDEDQPTEEEDTFEFEESSYWDDPNFYYWGYWPDEYSWQEQDNPCHVSYYTSSRFVKTNILATDIGLIAKSGSDGEMMAIVTDMITAEPLAGILVEVYNYQLQKIGSASSNAEGIAFIEVEGSPFMMIASQGTQKSYLRIDDGSALSVSDFDVSGKKIKKGIRGFIYGDRGVWRPGDTIFLNFILDDRKANLPDGHPLVLELLNPYGRIVKRIVKTSPEGNIYKLTTKTSAEAPTGNWTARIKVGGVTFTKSLRIETIKPNRLKVNLDLGEGPLQGGRTERGTLEVNWLHGAVARNLKARVEMSLYKSNKGFEQYPGYIFSDPSRYFYPDEMIIFDERVDKQGKADISFTPPEVGDAPGMLQAAFTIRAFEEGGDFSTDYFTIDYAPYKTFIGIRIPEGDKRGMLLTDTTHSVNVISCNAKGKPVRVKNLHAAIYKVSWRWWWNATENDMASYFGSEYSVPIDEAVIGTDASGKGTFKFKVEYPDWGRYFVRVWDPNGGAAAGKTVYIDWPGWAGQAKREFPGAASLLTFTADKDKYQVGETATVVFPSSGEGRALISIESGSEILHADWVKPDSGQ
ncbi:MAG: hypothetical protein DRJ15_05300, partial [Bacteroidetes bacterium]